MRRNMLTNHVWIIISVCKHRQWQGHQCERHARAVSSTGQRRAYSIKSDLYAQYMFAYLCLPEYTHIDDLTGNLDNLVAQSSLDTSTVTGSWSPSDAVCLLSVSTWSNLVWITGHTSHTLLCMYIYMHYCAMCYCKDAYKDAMMAVLAMVIVHTSTTDCDGWYCGQLSLLTNADVTTHHS